jgi:hypothetical protein
MMSPYKLTSSFCLRIETRWQGWNGTPWGFDLFILRCIPNMIIYSPLDKLRYKHFLYTTQLGHYVFVTRGRGVVSD